MEHLTCWHSFIIWFLSKMWYFHLWEFMSKSFYILLLSLLIVVLACLPWTMTNHSSCCFNSLILHWLSMFLEVMEIVLSQNVLFSHWMKRFLMREDFPKLIEEDLGFIWKILLMTFFNFLEVKSHICNFFFHLVMQLTTSQKIIFNAFWEIKILSFSKSTFWNT